jgi:hypothetical protein
MVQKQGTKCWFPVTFETWNSPLAFALTFNKECTARIPVNEKTDEMESSKIKSILTIFEVFFESKQPSKSVETRVFFYNKREKVLFHKLLTFSIFFFFVQRVEYS